MSDQLEMWLNAASRKLSKDSKATVRAEIQEHYESAFEAAVAEGASTERADWLAVRSLGDPSAANREYRKHLFTSAEARILREANWECNAICSSSALKAVLLITPVIALMAAMSLLSAGVTEMARILFVGAAGLAVLLVGPFLPIYTPERARIYRVVKWVTLVGMIAFALGSNIYLSSSLFAASLWPIIWIEWTRETLRRKLPVARWPKQL